METTQQQQQQQQQQAEAEAAIDVAYSEVNCSQHCRPLGSSSSGSSGGGCNQQQQQRPPPPPANAPPVREEEWRETADGGAWGVAGEWRVERLTSLAARQVVVLNPSWRLSLAPRLPHDLALLLRHAAASAGEDGAGVAKVRGGVQAPHPRAGAPIRRRLRSRLRRRRLPPALPLATQGTRASHRPPPPPPSAAAPAGETAEFYGLFDGLSVSGDEAWTKGVNLWPLTMCLKSLPGVFGDEDLAQEWVEVQESRGLPRENCSAWPTWLPLGCESESTIFFINCAPASPYFGQLRYVVTTVQDDRFLACSLGKFFGILERYVDQTGGGDDAPSLTAWLHRNADVSHQHHHHHHHHNGHKTATAAHK